MKVLDMKDKPVMLFKKNMEYLHGLGKDFFNKTQKPLAIKERTDKFDYIKMKNFCHQRTIYKKKKWKEITEWEKILSVLQHLFQ